MRNCEFCGRPIGLDRPWPAGRKQYVAVRFLNYYRSNADMNSRQEYSYQSDLQCRPHDIVICETIYGPSVAIVTNILPEGNDSLKKVLEICGGEWYVRN